MQNDIILISGRLGIVQTEVEAVLALLWREEHDKVGKDFRKIKKYGKGFLKKIKKYGKGCQMLF